MSNVENLIVKYNVSDAEITKIAEEMKGVSADTTEGYQMVVKGIRCTRELRSKVESCRVALKADALAFGRKVDGEAKRITQELLEIETPLKLLKKVVDDEKARIKLQAENKKREEERLKMEARLEEERKAREAHEKIEREKRETKERDAREARIAKARIEREAHEKLVAEERERMKVEREAQEKRFAEQKITLERENLRLKEAKEKQDALAEQERKKAKTVADQLMEERKALETRRRVIEKEERGALEVEKQRQKMKDDAAAKKEYLGDGVYIALTPVGVVLEVSDGINATDTVFLGASELTCLVRYLNNHNLAEKKS